jgi:hypothetical protein
MQILRPRMIILAILVAGGLFGQSLAGTWQGTVRPPDRRNDQAGLPGIPAMDSQARFGRTVVEDP